MFDKIFQLISTYTKFVRTPKKKRIEKCGKQTVRHTYTHTHPVSIPLICVWLFHFRFSSNFFFIFQTLHKSSAPRCSCCLLQRLWFICFMVSWWYFFCDLVFFFGGEATLKSIIFFAHLMPISKIKFIAKKKKKKWNFVGFGVAHVSFRKYVGNFIETMEIESIISKLKS